MFDGIVDYLKDEGLSLLGTVLTNPAGAVLKVVSDTLGTSEDPKAIEKEIRQNPEAIAKLKELEIREKGMLQEHALKVLQAHNENTSSAREMYKVDSESQKALVKHINIQFYFSVAIGLVTLFLTARYIADKGMAMALTAFISSIITLVTTRVQVLDNFFFGSSASSKQKTSLLENTKKSK